MAEYGLTPNGINIKRLDVILDEMQEYLTNAWGVNVKQNPESFLNLFLTNVADELAELWEFGQDVHNCLFVTTAEGMYLDNVSQYAGVPREENMPSYYYILCTGIEGTVIPSDTIISSTTNPVVNFTPTASYTISRSSFNTVVVRLTSLDGSFSVAVGGESAVVPASAASGKTELAILNLISTAVNGIDGVSSQVDETAKTITITSDEPTTSNALTLSDNMTTVTVGCVVSFATEEDGDIFLPEGTITVITKAVSGLKSVTNVGDYIAGRLLETDTEFRQSYMDKIFSHSSRMSQSIRSAILTNCKGVSACAVYTNDGDAIDADGRYPHSIEVVVDGGDASAIAEQILDTKADGINTYGQNSTTVQDENGDDVIIRYTRPSRVYVFFHVTVSVANGATLPTDYADTIKEIIVAGFENISCGDDFIPQETIIGNIYKRVTGVAYVDILMATTESTTAPAESAYTLRTAYANARQKLTTDTSMIRVGFV